MFNMWTSLEWAMFQITFGILIHCLMQWPSYVLRCTHPFSTFIKSFSNFDSSFLQVFGHLLGPRSIDNPKGHLGHKQTSLLIIFGGIKLILTSSMSQPHFGQVWGWSPTLPKLGTWSPPGLKNVQSSTAGAKTPRIGVFLMSLERSWSVDV